MTATLPGKEPARAASAGRQQLGSDSSQPGRPQLAAHQSRSRRHPGGGCCSARPGTPLQSPRGFRPPPVICRMGRGGHRGWARAAMREALAPSGVPRCCRAGCGSAAHQRVRQPAVWRVVMLHQRALLVRRRLEQRRDQACGARRRAGGEGVGEAPVGRDAPQQAVVLQHQPSQGSAGHGGRGACCTPPGRHPAKPYVPGSSLSTSCMAAGASALLKRREAACESRPRL